MLEEVAPHSGSHSLPTFLRHSGGMGTLIAAHDWSRTELGPIEGWSASLKSAVSMVLAAKPGMALLCGRQGTLIYNEAYAETCGKRHPAALGTSVLTTWPEAADFNRNVLEVGFAGESLAYRDTPLTLTRNGFPEQTWFDLSYSPLRDDNGDVLAVFAVVSEVTSLHVAQDELRSEQERFRQALNSAGVIGIWDWHFDTNLMFTDARFAEFYSVDPARASMGAPRAEFDAHVHPDDRAYVEEETQRVAASGGDLSIEHRLIGRDGRVRWVMVRGTGFADADGQPARLSGAAVEITNRKNAEEARRLLIRELHHRIKNTFAVIAGMVTMTARSAADVNEMAEVLRGRLVALAAAHELIRPAITAEVGHTEQTTLADLFTAILTPHLYFPEQFTLTAPPVEIGVAAATSLALVLHELATNAAKYGALSTAKGRLDVTARFDDNKLELDWVESGGPSVTGPPRHQGFGSRLASMSIVGQLAGSIDFKWAETGLDARLVMSRERLSR
ncbi:PAS domain S-box-containing protein [Kaistia soli DSM 19436]|uniref:Blue-light-activated histidine kinase n=1 Tax=Kaistia soli DSM 19436 TaxID=1122133 RepID=A0A1M4V6N8_9HYPH|nr:sensor histidine kinase [Kaistia soli]SHE64557.1 PAS domain S-box-containing protein [Kaistia soli DSM 19436]